MIFDEVLGLGEMPDEVLLVDGWHEVQEFRRLAEHTVIWVEGHYRLSCPTSSILALKWGKPKPAEKPKGKHGKEYKQNYPYIDCLADPAGVMHNAPVITCNMPVTNKELVMCDKHAAEWQKLHGKE